jgi:2-oxoglutarate dehydrogenase E2 component (dihydrolipoamide succinyltransferase)
MKQDVQVPAVGESITSGVIVTWLVHTGDQVREGQNLFELETDKAVLEIPSPAAGTLEILVDEGTEVSIGQTVATVDTEAGAGQPAVPIAETPPAATEKTQVAKEAPPVPEPSKAEPSDVPALEDKQAVRPPAPAPAAAKPPAPVAPSPAAQASGERHTERVPMSAIRRKTAERLVKAKQTAAYLTTFNEIDMAKVIEIRRQYKDDFLKEHGIKIGFMSFFVKACCQALKEYRGVNAMIDGDDVVYNDFYDIGVAVSIERGLVVPIVRNADKLNFAEIEAAIADLAKRAQEKRLAPDELTGGTFTIRRIDGRDVHHHERGHLRVADVDADTGLSAERHLGDARDKEAPGCHRRRDRHSADDVRRAILRPSDHRRPRGGQLPCTSQRVHRGPGQAAAGTMTAGQDYNNQRRVDATTRARKNTMLLQEADS